MLSRTTTTHLCELESHGLVAFLVHFLFFENALKFFFELFVLFRLFVQLDVHRVDFLCYFVYLFQVFAILQLEMIELILELVHPEFKEIDYKKLLKSKREKRRNLELLGSQIIGLFQMSRFEPAYLVLVSLTFALDVRLILSVHILVVFFNFSDPSKAQSHETRSELTR